MAGSSSVYLESLFEGKVPAKKTSKPAPPSEDSQQLTDDVSVWQVLASQTEYLQKLEAANKRFHEESRFLRENLRNLVEDNSRLYSELKGALSQRIEELADKRTSASSGVVSKNYDDDPEDDEGSGVEEEEEEEEEAADARGVARRAEPKALSNLVRMHSARADRLEAEVRALKTQLDSSRLVISELKSRDGGGSCSGSTGSMQIDADTMLKLMNERDEAVGRIARLVERLNVCDQHRQALESDLKDSLKLVDEAVRERQNAVDEKMRYAERVSAMERKMVEERESADRRLEQAVKVIRSGAAEQVKTAEEKMTLAVAESLRHEQRATRMSREYKRLQNEAEQAKTDAAKYEQELADANADFKATLARVLADRDVALRELSRLRALTSQERGDADCDRGRLAEQLRLARGQIAECQQELNTMAAERLQAVSQMNDALAQVEAERRQRSELEDEVDAVRRELTSHAQNLKQQAESSGGELRKIVEQQADLIRRLRAECDRLLSGYTTEKSEADRLRAENGMLLTRLRRSQEELGSARFDASASAQVQDALRWRMAELDARAKQAKAEVDDILSRSHGSRSLTREAVASVPVNKSLNSLRNDDLLALAAAAAASEADDDIVNEVVTRHLSPRQKQEFEEAERRLFGENDDERDISSASVEEEENENRVYEDDDDDDDDEEEEEEEDDEDEDGEDKSDGDNTED